MIERIKQLVWQACEHDWVLGNQVLRNLLADDPPSLAALPSAIEDAVVVLRYSMNGQRLDDGVLTDVIDSLKEYVL